MERVVRNNTRKSSLFKIQAQKNKFEDHFTDFGCCRLLENHPECAKYEVPIHRRFRTTSRNSPKCLYATASRLGRVHPSSRE